MPRSVRLASLTWSLKLPPYKPSRGRQAGRAVYTARLRARQLPPIPALVEAERHRGEPTSAAHLKFRLTSAGHRAPRLLERRLARMPAASALPDELFPACPADVGWPRSSRLATQIAAPPPGDIVRRPLGSDTCLTTPPLLATPSARHELCPPRMVATAGARASARLGWATRTATALTRHMILASTTWSSVRASHTGASPDDRT
ncbi:unnamed protein product [Urochloa humidicola]